MADTKTANASSFSYGSAFQVGGFSINKSQFRLRTIARGYFLQKSDNVLGSGQGLLVREFKVVWNQKTVTPSFKLLTTCKTVQMGKEYMSSYFEDKCSGDYFFDVDENDTLGHETQLSCRKAAWFKMYSDRGETDLEVYLKKACIAIFSTEDREGGFYFEQEVAALVDKLLDPEYMKEQTNRDTLFEEFYNVEKKIDRMRKKKGASKRLLSKMVSLVTLLLTEKKIKAEETVEFLKDDKTKFSIKEIAKLAYNLCVDDITIIMRTIKNHKEEVATTSSDNTMINMDD